MNIGTQRFVDKWVGVPLCAGLSVLHHCLSIFSRADTKRMQQARPQILVILLSEMGSLVLAHPMFLALRRRYPNADIHALMFTKNQEVIGLLGLDPAVHVMTVRDTGLLALVLDSIRAMWRMRSLKLAAVLDCELFSRVSAVFGAVSGAEQRIGFHAHTQEGLYRGNFFTSPVLYNPHRHIADQFLTLAAAIQGPDGAASTPPAKHWASTASQFELPRLAAGPGELAQVQKKLLLACPSAGSRPLALIYASGGILPIRAWPQSHFEALAREWVAQGYSVGVVGLPADAMQAEAIVQAVGSEHCVSLAGLTANVRELVLLFHHAKVLVANDGGPGHFAVLAGLPNAMLFGPETPRLYGSLSPRSIPIHRADTPCSPCLTAFNHRLSPCDGDNQCLKRVDVAQVLRAAERAIATEPRR